MECLRKLVLQMTAKVNSISNIVSSVKMWHKIWVYHAENMVWHLGVKVNKTYVYAFRFVIQNNPSLLGENIN